MSVLEVAIWLRREFRRKAMVMFGTRVGWVGNELLFLGTKKRVPGFPMVSLGLRP